MSYNVFRSYSPLPQLKQIHSLFRTRKPIQPCYILFFLKLIFNLSIPIVLPVDSCVCGLHWRVLDPWRVTSLKKAESPFTNVCQSPPTLGVRSISTSFLPVGILSSLSLHRSSAFCLSGGEFICMATLLTTEDPVSFQVIHCLCLLQSFCPLFHDSPSFGMELWYRCLILGWAFWSL